MELSATDFSRDLSAKLSSSAQPTKSIVIENRSPSIIKQNMPESSDSFKAKSVSFKEQIEEKSELKNSLR